MKHPRAVSKAKAFAPGERTLPELSPSWERALLPLQLLLASLPVKPKRKRSTKGHGFQETDWEFCS